MSAAALVISHAGAGSVIESLRAGRPRIGGGFGAEAVWVGEVGEWFCFEFSGSPEFSRMGVGDHESQSFIFFIDFRIF